MVLPARVTVSVPGSSANLGPGFDCLGVALPLRLTVVVRRASGPALGAPPARGPTSCRPTRRTSWCATILDRRRRATDCGIEIANELPLAAGCGSSAAAIVAGLAAFDALVGRPVDRDEI